MFNDLRHAVRGLLRTPGFTAAAVVSLALGIGGNVLMFGLADSLVLHPFPYPDPGRLIAIGVNFPRVADEERFIEALSAPEYEDIRQSQSLQKVMAFDLGNRNISGGDRPERVFTALVTDDVFDTIGIAPAMGRMFLPEEIQNGRRVAILSHRLWQSRFAADPSLVGRPIRINGVESIVVGIMPPGLLLLGTDLWVPLPIGADWPRHGRNLTVLGRLRPGVSMEQANAELAVLSERTASDHASTNNEYTGWRLRAETWANALTGEHRPAVMLLLGTVALVLLITCVNITNLLLTRAAGRQREIAVRLALGAGRWRMARQLFVESLVIAVAGTSAGLILVRFGLDAAASFLPFEIAGALGVQPAIGARVLIYSAFVACAAALLVGLLPAWHASSSNPESVLRSEGRSSTAGRGAQRLRFGLIVGEVALTTVLLVGAGLLLKSWSRLNAVEPGLRVNGVLTMRVTLPPEKYRGEAIPNFFTQLIERVRMTPGVQNAAVASLFPPMSFSQSQVRVDGHQIARAGELPSALFTIVSPGYFSTLDIPVLAGRTFTDADRADALPVAVVNETFAAKLLGTGPAVGRRVEFNQRWLDIVGVTRDTRNGGVKVPPRPEVYLTVRQAPPAWNQYYLLVAARGDAMALLPEVRRAIASIDSEQPAYAVQTLDDVFAVSTLRERASTSLLGAFAALALLLAAVGIYGVMSFAVASRTREIGVRMALGADGAMVRRDIVLQAAGLVAVGLALGLVASFALRQAISGLLFEVTARDPVSFLIAALVLGTVGLSAAFWPARRASLVDPIVALRCE
jgi:putative ABC transport system permease protein